MGIHIISDGMTQFGVGKPARAVRSDTGGQCIPGLEREFASVETRSVEVSLKGFGRAPTRAQVVIGTLTLRERGARAAVALGAGLALAVIALPIPLVHLILVPGALLLGISFAAIRVGQREVFRSAEGVCPYCGARQRLGLAGRAFRLPREVFCGNCQRALDLGGD
jgi:hypothetical protein